MNRNEINVQQYGALGNGKQDDTAAIQEAFREAVKNKSTAVFFPATDQFYNMTGTVLLEGVKNLKIYGEGLDKSYIKNTSTKANEKVPLFIVTKGTDSASEEQSENICFEGLTLQRGSAKEENADIDEVCIRVEYTTHLYVKKIKLTDSDNGLSIRRSSFVQIDECNTYKMTLSHISLRECVSDVSIRRTTMDTTTTKTEEHPYRYLLHMGVSNYEETFEFDVKNVHIENCQFRNNPDWEGIDSHGVTNLTISNCTIENCASGIMIGKYHKCQTENLFGNIKIVDNTIIQGTATIGLSGIMVKGGQHPASLVSEYGTALGENILITRNTITGFGNHGSSYAAGIFVQNAMNVNVNTNTVNGSVRTAFGMMYVVFSDIYENTFLNTVLSDDIAYTGSTTIAPVFFGPGCYFLDFAMNTIWNHTGFPVTHGIINTSRGMANYKENTIVSSNVAYKVINAQMTGELKEPIIGIPSWSKVRRQDGKIIQICTNTDNTAVVRSVYKDTGMTASSLFQEPGDGMTSELEFSKTILNELSLCEEFELDLPINGKVRFTLTELKNGKIGIVTPQIPEEFEALSVYTLASTWKQLEIN